MRWVCIEYSASIINLYGIHIYAILSVQKIATLEGCSMKILFVALCFFLLFIVDVNASSKLTKFSYPASEQIIVVDEIHGHKIPDPFRWLEDDESIKTRNWIKDQQAFADAQLSNLKALPMFEKVLARMKKAELHGSPTVAGDFTFVWKHPVNSNFWQYIVIDEKGMERVLLDPSEFSEDGTANISILDTNKDGTIVAYGVTLTGADEMEIRFRDTVTGKDLREVLPYGLYDQVKFKTDGKGYYYTKRTRGESVLIYSHQYGTDFSDDEVLFGQGQPLENWISIDESDSGRYLLFSVEHGWTRSDLYLRDTRSDGETKAIVKGLDGLFMPWFIGEKLYIYSNLTANNGEVYEVDLSKLNMANWKLIIPEDAERVIEDINVADNMNVITYLQNVQHKLHVFSPEGEFLYQIPVPAHSQVTRLSSHKNSEVLYFGTDTFLAGRKTFEFNVKEKKSSLYTESKVPFDSDKFEVKQYWVTSKDGTRFPISILGAKGFHKMGPRPTILYGYGGFAQSIMPRFSDAQAAWIEAGGNYVIANIRGGSEFGKEWHRQGQLQNKQNVFDDFIAAANWLKEEGFTTKKQLAIQGGSNGGLLVGAVTTQKPDLANVVLCHYPDLDMIGYYRFKNNNAPALKEYGDASIKAHFDFLIKYSPYQNVKQGVSYPAMYISSGDFDTRVPPLQARKMTAKLQQFSSGVSPIILKYDEQSGHTAGGSNTQMAIKKTAEYLAFAAKYTGLSM